MTCCLPRWGRRPSCPVLGAGPCPRSCWLAARRVGDGLHRLVRVGCYRAILPRGSCASSFASDAAVSKGSLGPGEGRGLFCESSGRDPQHGAGPGEGTGGSFASEVELLKGYRHFASVITLAKRGIAVKAEASLWKLARGAPGLRCPWARFDPLGCPGVRGARTQALLGQVRPRPPRLRQRPPGRRELHWGRLITCPNAQFPTPMARILPWCGHASCPDGLFPAPMRIGALPQCAVSCPNGPYPAPVRIGALPQWPVSCPGADRRPAPVARILLRCGRARSDHAV